MKSRRAANDYQSSSEKAAVLRGDAHTLIQLVVSQLVVSQFEFWMALISRSAPASYMIGALGVSSWRKLRFNSSNVGDKPVSMRNCARLNSSTRL